MVWEDTARAMPKSATFTLPSRLIIMFWGLMSRWMMCCSWAAAIPWATWMEMPMASLVSSWPFFSMYCFNVMPSMSSITM